MHWKYTMYFVPKMDDGNHEEIVEEVHTAQNVLGPYTTHPTPILLLCAPYKPTTIIVVPLH